MILGLTGGIATGKSTVSAMLKAHGAVIVDADRIAREVVQPGMPAYRQIVERFGKEILLPDGQIDRKALGKIVFADAGARQELMMITHPPIREKIDEEIEKARKRGEPLIVLDAPLLIESGLESRVDRVVVVYADQETQLKRLMKRDKLSKEEALARIAAQMPMEEKKKYADFLLDNNGSEEELKKQVDQLIETLRKGE